MGSTFFTLSDGMRRLLGALVAVAFLMASVGIGHSMPASGPHDHPVETTSPHADDCHARVSQVEDCGETAAQQDQGQPATHGTLGNCCVVACSPTVIVAAIAEVAVITFSGIRLGVHVDRFAGSNAPDGLFRPPRARV
ncbi:MAG: hypothetical protein C0456_19385 [Hyphomonas sp.]|jgi:hypothetical protein|nr:hypothetical protein [Hyphomonas sp.]